MSGYAEPKMQERQCLVTGEKANPRFMLRFALDPQGQVVPDIKKRLPGRGVWINTSKVLVEKAVAKSQFEKGFRQKVQANSDLANQVLKLLENQLVQSLSMAKKAGLVLNGFQKVNGAIRSGKAVAAFHASDGGEDGRSKIEAALRTFNEIAREEGLAQIQLFEMLDVNLLGKALGHGNVVNLALVNGGATRAAIGMAEELKRYVQ